MTNMDLQLDMSLQRLAMLSYATWFWNRPDVQDKIKDINELYVLNRHDAICDKDKCFSFIVKAKKELETIAPAIILDKLMYVIKSTGIKVYEWAKTEQCFIVAFKPRGMKCTICLVKERTKVLHWNMDGTIDKPNIVETKWFTSDFNVHTREYGYTWKNGFLYYHACACVSINIIHLYWEDMYNFCMHYYYNDKCEIFTKSQLDFIMCSILFLNVSKGWKRNYIYKKHFKTLQYSKEVHMFLLSVNNACDVAVQYYWKLLNEIEKRERLLPNALACIQLYHNPNDVLRVFAKSAYRTNILVFFFMQMTQGERLQFILSEEVDPENLLVMFIESCTWEEFFFPIFDAIKNRNRDKKFYNTLLARVIAEMTCDYNWGLGFKKTPHYRMFRAIWNELEVCRSDGNHLIFPSLDGWINLKNLYTIFDLEILTLLINFECEKLYKKEFLTEGKKKFKELIKEKQFALLDEFMRAVLESEEEAKWFKKDVLNISDQSFTLALQCRRQLRCRRIGKRNVRK